MNKAIIPCRADDCLQPSMWCGWCSAHCDGTDEHGEYMPEDDEYMPEDDA